VVQQRAHEIGSCAVVAVETVTRREILAQVSSSVEVPQARVGTFLR
jgi:hypothetical protein